jgi:putative hemolysin
MANLAIYLVVIFILLLLSAFFSGSETALFSLKKGDLARFRSSKSRKERNIASLMRSPQKILITILIGNLFVNTYLSALTTKILSQKYSAYGHFITIPIVSVLVIIFCEITPKVISINNYEYFSKKIIRLLYFFHKLILPLRLIFVFITNLFIKLFRIKIAHEVTITEDELNMAVSMSESNGVLREEEGGFIKNVLRFSQKEALNIMIPRNEAVAISVTADISEALRVFQRESLVRVPVYDGDKDHIVGQIDSRDLIPHVMGYKKAKTIKRLIKPIDHYPASKELGELLDEFLKNKIQIAVVVDEYGGTAGIVTLSAIISEVLGDKFSLEEERKKTEIQKIDSKTFIITGEIQIQDFCYEFNDKIDECEAETIGGYFIEQVGHFPKRGETITINDKMIKVKKINKNKIELLEVKIIGNNN